MECFINDREYILFLKTFYQKIIWYLFTIIVSCKYLDSTYYCFMIVLKIA